MNRTEKIALPAVVFLLAAACLMQVLAAYAGDKIWLLQAAKMWVGGRRLDVEIIEVNPPLIVWIYGLAVWLSLHLAPLRDYQALAWMGLAASAFSVWLCARLLRLHPALGGERRHRLYLLLLIGGLFVYYTPPGYFFDREHILLVGSFPYMLRFMPSLAAAKLPLRLRVAIGVMAALGFCIKPHAIIVFAGLQLTFMLQQRSAVILKSVENGIIYGCGVLYLFCVWHFTPDYVTTILPMALATYSAFSRRIVGLFYAILALMIAGVVFADFRPRHKTPYRRDIYYFIGAALALLAYAEANNGWGYTFHPLICLLLFLAGWVGLEHLWLLRDQSGKGQPVRQFVFGARACGITLLVYSACIMVSLKSFYATPECDWSADCRKNQPYLQYLKEHHVRSFGALTEDFHKWAWLARLSGADLDTRYNALWMVPQLVIKGEPFTREHQWIVDTVGRGLADDLNTRMPPVVFVDDSSRFFGTEADVSLPAFFSVVPQFKDAWSRYRYDSTIDRCAGETDRGAVAVGCRYDIYRRAP